MLWGKKVKFLMPFPSQRHHSQVQKDVLIAKQEKYFYLLQLAIFFELRYVLL
jgi:hypothetical protein